MSFSNFYLVICLYFRTFATNNSKINNYINAQNIYYYTHLSC